MDWQEKLKALKALSGDFDTALRMRSPGDWYLSDRIEIGGNGMLASPTCAAPTPEAAVETMWKRYVDNLPPDRYLVINAMNSQKRRHVRWNGYMWEDLPVE